MEVGERETIYLSLHCHHQNDFCIKMGSDESHFNVSEGSDGQSHKTVSTNLNLFEEKGELKRYGTEARRKAGSPGYRGPWTHPQPLPSEDIKQKQNENHSPTHTCVCHYRVPGEIKRREVELDPRRDTIQYNFIVSV